MEISIHRVKSVKVNRSEFHKSKAEYPFTTLEISGESEEGPFRFVLFNDNDLTHIPLEENPEVKVRK